MNLGEEHTDIDLQDINYIDKIVVDGAPLLAGSQSFAISTYTVLMDNKPASAITDWDDSTTSRQSVNIGTLNKVVRLTFSDSRDKQVWNEQLGQYVSANGALTDVRVYGGMITAMH